MPASKQPEGVDFKGRGLRTKAPPILIQSKSGEAFAAAVPPGKGIEKLAGNQVDDLRTVGRPNRFADSNHEQ
jgi:hypothetical protein